MVVRMFPIFLTTIFYWTIYSQASALLLLLCFGRTSCISRDAAVPC